MKRSTLFKLFFSLTAIVALERFCRTQTGGFRFSKATSSHVYPFPISSAPAPKELNQPFYFLGSGVQCFAFVSKDQTTVLKLFKHHHWGPSTDLLEKLISQPYADTLIKKREQRMVHLFESASIAFQTLPEQTGVIYTHLGKTHDTLGKIPIYDKLGIAHQLDLDVTEFVLQKKAICAEEKLHILFKQHKVDDAIEAMQQLLALIESRSKQGIKNKDGHVLQNCGFLGDTPIELDIGSYAIRSSSTNPNPHKSAKLKATLQLLGWVKTQYPESLQPCKQHLLHENTF